MVSIIHDGASGGAPITENDLTSKAWWDRNTPADVVAIVANVSDGGRAVTTFWIRAGRPRHVPGRRRGCEQIVFPRATV